MAKLQTFTGVDQTLFHIAMRQYGNALAWYRIAQSNGLLDYMIVGTVELTLPSPDPTPPTGAPTT
jgi:hypothetical protein